MRRLSSYGSRLGIVLALSWSATATALEPAQLPSALRDWIPWVRDGHEARDCPLLVGQPAGEAGSRVCAWPGELALDADAAGARFSQRWTVYARSAVPLPGDAGHWPQSVRVDALAAPVLPDGNGMPQVWLEAGTHLVEGRHEWARRPEAIALPDAVGLVALRVDGAPIFPLQREGGQLWLGAPPEQAQETDSLVLRVYRRLRDGVPAELETRVELDISGAGREETLGNALPAGFVALALDGDLPARLDGDGVLTVQARPGSYSVSLRARALEPLARVARPASAAPWPAQEVWSFEAAPRLRVAEAGGAPQIDPAQAGVPGEWQAIPAFVLQGDAALEVTERTRGLSPQDQNRLVLRRSMWLDFDGADYSTEDRVEGRLVRDWRLDVAAPFVLTRAASAGEGLLVTQGATPALTGVELRTPQLQLSASTRLAGAGGELPVSGWQQAFDAVETTLDLPPGYRLYAAIGADRSPQAWLSRWNLLDIFLVAVTVLVARWLGGRLLALVTLPYLVLAWQESGAPLVLLLAVLAVALLAKLVPAEGRMASVLSGARLGALVLLVLVALPFAATQLRLALHPQLERGSPRFEASYDEPGRFAGGIAADAPAPAAAPPVLAMESKAMQEADGSDRLESITVTGSRINAQAMVSRYASNLLLQAGYGEPGWSWARYSLGWSGPVLPDQSVRLVIAPPWLTRALRVLVVALLALLVVRLARDDQRPRRAGASAGSAAALVAALALSGGMALPAPAGAQALPSEELLQQLRDKVFEAPQCAPQCGSIAQARVIADGDNVRVALEVHAAARVALPLPADEERLAQATLSVDGVAVSGVLRRGGSERWIVLERGVHRVELGLRAGTGDQVALRFPLQPGALAFDGRGWEASGIREGRLLTDTLQLVRVRESAAGIAAGVAQQFPPFVMLERRLMLDLDWYVQNTIRRVAPLQAGFSPSLPLLSGERVTTAGLTVADGRVTVPLQAGEGSAQWSSQLDRVDTLTLVAPALDAHAEVWRIVASPTWNVRAQGVPMVHGADGEDSVLEFHPLPGETLVLTIARPAPVPGPTLAIDGVTLETAIGKRARDSTLTLQLRSTQGGQHAIALPAAAEVMGVTIDGTELNLRPENGKLVLPIAPGAHSASVRWREAGEIGLLSRTATVGLAAQASNLETTLALPADRWVLNASGPRIGPAVLYWAELALMVLVAWALSRLRRTPLRFWQWLLLGLGFSTFSWSALLVVAAWLFALDARARLAPVRNDTGFNLAQAGLALLTLVAVVAVVSAIPQGLLGTPDMHLAGNGSTPTQLRWFADRTSDAIAPSSAVTVSMWWYKAAMLAWALWLSNALIGWLRWGWQAWSAGGYWRAAPRRTVSNLPEPPTPPTHDA